MNRLSQGAWFGGLPLALRQLVLERSRVRTYARGQLLSIEGDPAKGLFLVLEGQVHVVTTVASGDEALIHVAEPGCWLGEFAVLTGARTIVTFIAHSKVRALFFPKDQFDLIIDQEPRYYPHFANLIYERYAAMLRALVEIQEPNPEVRLRRRLAAMARLRQSDRSEPGPVVLGVTQTELARMVGVSRQTLNALLGDLQRQALLTLGFRTITVMNPDGFAEFPEGDEAKRRVAQTAARAPVPEQGAVRLQSSK